jgi:hypothetical protein
MASKPVEFKVESGVPVSAYPGGKTRKYPFDRMKVNDSFIVTSVETMKRARNAAYLYGGRNNCKFTCRKDIRHKSRWRIWRVS